MKSILQALPEDMRKAVDHRADSIVVEAEQTPNPEPTAVLTEYQARKAQLNFEFSQRAKDCLHDLQTRTAMEAGELGFIPAWAVRASLPYQQLKNDADTWTRKSGDYVLIVQPGVEVVAVTAADGNGRQVQTEESVSVGLPYGVYPRLINIYATTEVIRSGRREVEFGSRFQEWMKSYGRDITVGGERGVGTLVKRQMKRLAMANFSLSRGHIDGKWSHLGFRIFDEACIETSKRVKGDGVWHGSFVLSEICFEEMARLEGAPIDQRILRLLSDAPMAMDIYQWITHRAYSLNRDLKLPWMMLMEQFGSEVQSPGKFKQIFCANLTKVEQGYPALRNYYAVDSRGLTLRAGIKPSVASAPKKLFLGA